MQNKKLNVKLIGEPGDRVTNKDLLKAINALSIRIDQVEANLNTRIDQVEANLNTRIDNLVTKNNLTE